MPWGAIGGALAVLAVLAGAVVVVISTVTSKSRELLREENADYARRLAQVETEYEACKARMSSIEAANQVLADQVTGASAIKELGATIEEHHAELLEQQANQYTDLLEGLDKVVEALATIAATGKLQRPGTA